MGKCQLKEIFKKFDTLILNINNCIEDEKTLNINLTKFSSYDSEFKEHYFLYGAIYNKAENKYTKINNKFKFTFSANSLTNNLIITKKRTTIFKSITTYSKYQNSDNYEVHLILIPLIKDKIDLIREVNECFDSIFIDENKKYNKERKFLMKHFEFNLKALKILLLYFSPVFFVVLLPIYIFSYLIYYGGFVESLIDINTISNVIGHVLSHFVKLLYESKEIIVLLILIISLVFTFALFGRYYGVNLYINTLSLFIKVIYNIFIKFLHLFCFSKFNTLNILYEKEEIKVALGQINKYIYNFIGINLNILLFLFNVFYIVFLCFLYVQMVDSTENKNLPKTNLIHLLSSEYIKYSAFPSLSKIQNNDDNTSDIKVFVGYDRTFSYSYNITTLKEAIDKSKIKEKLTNPDLSDNLKNIKDKYCSPEKSIENFNDFYITFILGNINNSSIIPIKNINYKFTNITNDNKEYIEIMQLFKNNICPE